MNEAYPNPLDPGTVPNPHCGPDLGRRSRQVLGVHLPRRRRSGAAESGPNPPLARIPEPYSLRYMRDQKDRAQYDTPATDAWNPWRPDEAMKRLAGVRAPWCVAGGWALDLWHGKATRPHDDLEIAILRPHFPIFRGQLNDLRFFVAASGQVNALTLNATPGSEKHQIRILDELTKAWRMEIFLEPGDGETWVFRRDETIRRARSQMIATTAEGVPYLKPEGVLLYKAKEARAKDERDFRVCLPLMKAAARTWLRDALARAHPCHPWIGDLEQAFMI